MKKIILLSLIVAGALSLGQVALADSANLSVLPGTLIRGASTPFTLALQLNPLNNKVCVVKGTLNFSNLSCQNIVVSKDVYVAKAPTCASPDFVLSIPDCTVNSQYLLFTQVQGTKLGDANLYVAGSVKVIGAGSDVPFTSNHGSYTIAATSHAAVGMGTSSNETLENSVIDSSVQLDSTVANSATQQPVKNNYLASLISAASPYFWILLILAMVGGGSYYLVKKYNGQDIMAQLKRKKR